MSQAGFALRGRNPDVLTCIANLSNDEVFTPPELANEMLDLVERAWADRHSGANIWADKTVRFLDPFTKSGVFLREITKRLVAGLEPEIPDLQSRVDHILTHQVFGIAITELTSLLARRSLYCSKWANGEHSIAPSMQTPAGNIWFERTEHVWALGKCVYCGANERDYGRGGELETHAYAFIHNEDPGVALAKMFGERMKFDVVIGNPPYQLGQTGGDSVGSFAMPIYQRFVRVAKSLDPQFLTMVIPSRWFAGGRGLDEFRAEMLGDRRVRDLVDFPDSREVFSGVDIAGGVCYFLWDSTHENMCEVTTVSGGMRGPSRERCLDDYDILVRYNEAISILEKVLATSNDSVFESLAPVVSPIQPFNLRTNFRGAPNSERLVDPVLLYQNGGTGYIDRRDIPRNAGWIDEWKVFLSSTASEHGGQTDKSGTRRVFSRILLGGPGTACTETYLVANRFGTEKEAENFATYLRTRFVRFLVSLRTNTQHLYSERFAFVPNLPMTRMWTDTDLYNRYGLSSEEVAYIESVIKSMDVADDSSD
jgi:site-specific DNA-methyltransferase (adenine-specific)